MFFARTSLVFTLLAMFVPGQPVWAAVLVCQGKAGAHTVRLRDMPPRIEADEAAVYRALREGRETPDNILRAALYASGVALADIGRYEALARTQFEAVRAKLPTGDADVQARALLIAMHASTLKEYVRQQTYIQGVLDSGYYNCVSSALLYNVFVGWLRVASGAVLEPSHAYSWVQTTDRRVQVQTTVASGYDYRGTAAEYQAFLRARGLGEGAKGAPELVSNRVLITAVLGNRLGWHHDGKHSDPSETDLLQILAVGRRILALAPEYGFYRELYTAELASLAETLSNRGRVEDAFAVARIELQMTKAGGEAGDQVRRRLVYHAGKLCQRLAEKAAWPAVDQVYADAGTALGCPRGGMCRDLALTVAQRLDAVALQLDGADNHKAAVDCERRAHRFAPIGSADAVRIEYNFAILFGHLLAAAVARDDSGAAIASWEAVRGGFDCTKFTSVCRAIDLAAAQEAGSRAMKLAGDKQSTRALAWSRWALQAVPRDDPDVGHVAESFLWVARQETDRLWTAGQLAEGDDLAGDSVRRAGCRPRTGAMPAARCADFADHMAYLWFDKQAGKAMAWANLALDCQPDHVSARRNYASLLFNEMLIAANGKDCTRVASLHDDVVRRGLGSADLDTLRAKCPR